jgi:lauroyl/myristoyl acyltransferase
LRFHRKPVATLMKIADALGVKVSDLLETDNETGTVFTPHAQSADTSKWISTNHGYSFFAFASARGNKAMQPYLFTARKDDVKENVFSHNGEEFIYMLEGQMKYRVGAIDYTMRAGDSVYFNSLEEHTFTLITDEVKYLAVFAGEHVDSD